MDEWKCQLTFLAITGALDPRAIKNFKYQSKCVQTDVFISIVSQTCL